MTSGTGMELDSRQYTYRSNRGTETHLVEFHDFARGTKIRRGRIYVAAVDVDSAFEYIPHTKLIQTVKNRNVNPLICRFIRNWLTQRIFSVRLTSPAGRCPSNWRPIGKGVPQGRILSHIFGPHISTNPFME